jgi:4-hydroxybenzoate polyprenyltransferase
MLLKFIHNRFFRFWNSKIPPLLFIVYYLISLNPSYASGWLSDIGLFIVSAIGFGLTGYMLNDWSDIDENRLQGKDNFAEGKPLFIRLLIVVACMVISFLPWWLIYTDGMVIGLLATQVVVYLLYSFKPVRLKERSWMGLLADAVYAHVLPVLLLVYAFSHKYHQLLPLQVMLGLVLYFTVMGLRNIINHQLQDFDADEKAGTNTFVIRYGKQRSVQFKNNILVPVEVVLMLLLFGFLPGMKMLAACFAVYAIYVFYREVHHIKGIVASGGEVNYSRYDFISGVLLNEYYEKWLPVIFLAIHISAVPVFANVLIFHLVLFAGNTMGYYSDYRFVFALFILPFKLIATFIYHHVLLKRMGLVYYHVKHAVFWYVYMPLKKIFVRNEH